MQFEVIRKSHKKEIILGVIVFILIAIVFIVHQSFAKYQTTKNVIIAEGTINYKIPDFNVIAMYKNDGAGDIEISTMPESGYTINESKSYCELNGSKDNNAKLYTDENGNHIISKLTKGDRCYIYFDKTKSSSEYILRNVTVNEGIPNFVAVATTDEGVFKAKDDDGDTYYFRGAVENNYVKFADKYWRIIRINGNKSIRLIYDGTSIHPNGTNTNDSIAVENQKFSHKEAYWNNSSDSKYVNDNMYVGFKYASGQVHGTGTKSNVLEQLELWYASNLSSYTQQLDNNSGFCGDRTPSSSTTTVDGIGGVGTTWTYYADYIRAYTKPSPDLTCPTEDLYTVTGSTKGNKSLTYPIGLINADEIVMAGGLVGNGNKKYFLYNGNNYWTLSPHSLNATVAYVYRVDYEGYPAATNVSIVNGIRPVINLKADVTLTGTGTAFDPYVVQ